MTLSFLLRTSESSATLEHFHYTDYVKPSVGIFHLSFITKCLLTQGKYQQAALGRELLHSVLFALKGSLKMKVAFAIMLFGLWKISIEVHN